MDTAADCKLYSLSLNGLLESIAGKHTVNCDSELMFIGNQYDISRLSDDKETSTLVIVFPDRAWTP